MLQQTVVVARGTWELEQAVAHAHQDQPPAAPVCVIGLTRSHTAKCWRICFVWQDAPLIWVSNHHRKADAETQIRRLLRLLADGGITDEATCTRAMQHLAAHSDAELGDLEAQARHSQRAAQQRYRDHHG